MRRLPLQLYLLLFLLHYFLGTAVAFRERPRMKFTEKETSITRRKLFNPSNATILIEEEDAVTIIDSTQFNFISFQHPQKSPGSMSVQWDECAKNECNYNITAVHESQEAKNMFILGTNGRESACCFMNISDHSAGCISSDKVGSIKDHIRDLNMDEVEASAFVESTDDADLYVAGPTGVRKFGKNCVRPAHRDKEQHFVKLVVSRQDRTHDTSQDKIYGFYNEKNADEDMYGDMWKPYVTQICLTDTGGPKNNLQFLWTSQLNARLFCGAAGPKQHFSELLAVATVEGGRWTDTRVYGLFQNEWGMRAVCVYKIQDIDRVFRTSPFKSKQAERSRMCVADSKKLPFETLERIQAGCEMERSVQSASAAPYLISRHHYTHITAHSFQGTHSGEHNVLFLALQSGAVHKVSDSAAGAFTIAEYKPFDHSAHIVSMSLNPSTRKLYVSSRTEVVQLDVANCHGYGNACEDCVLARDPYCGWSQGQCVMNGMLQDTEHGNVAKCPKTASKHSQIKEDQISAPRGSRYFLECPVSSLHASYSWYHDSTPVPCSWAEQQCLLLIQNAQPEQRGTYSCESEEQGHIRVLAQHLLTVEDGAAGGAPGFVLWVCLITVILFQSCL